MIEGWHQLRVPVPGKGEFLVPVRFNSMDPTKNEFGELPPEVAELFEVRVVAVPYLMPRRPLPPASPPD